MYVTSYKINNSYTTYVVHDCEEEVPKICNTQKSAKPLVWERGARVKHPFHGKGKIQDISHNQITVSFNNSKALRKAKNIIVTYEFKTKPSEIDCLHLCYK